MFPELFSVMILSDPHTLGWIVAAAWLLAAGLLAVVVRRHWPRTPAAGQLVPESESAVPSETSAARSVTTIALGAGLMLLVAHVVFALLVVPVFENMFASVNLALPEPTRTMMALSRSHLLAPSYIALDATVLLLWFRFGRPTSVQLFLVLGAAFALITVGSVATMYLPIMNMINAVQ